MKVNCKTCERVHLPISKLTQKILYFQQNLAFGLTEQYLFALSNSIDADRYCVHLVYPDAFELEPFKELHDEGVYLHRLPRTVFEGNISRALQTLVRLFQEIGPDLIHVNDPALVGLLAGKFYTHASIVFTHHTPELDRGYRWRGRLLEKIALSSHPAVIFTSEQDRLTGTTRDGVKEEQSVVIPYGIDVEAFEGLYDRLEVCRQFEIPPGNRIIGNVARLVPQKGHDVLIEAANLILARHPALTFILVGDGEAYDYLAESVRDRGLSDNFVFAGHHQDIVKLLHAFDVFVMPSLFEGLCMAVMEALAAARPVVASRVGGIPSTVIDGETGILVPSGDVRALADAITWMLENPEAAKNMGIHGRRRMKLHFTVDDMIARTEELYRTVLGHN